MQIGRLVLKHNHRYGPALRAAMVRTGLSVEMPETKNKRTPSNQSSVVSKCTSILDILAAADRPLSFAEISERSGLVKSSAHRVVTILLTEGLAEFDSRSKLYRLGPKLMSWALVAWRGNDLQQIARDELEHLREETGHNVELAVRDGTSVLFLRTLSSYPVRIASKAGDLAPLHCTAIGKVLVAFLPDKVRSEVLEKLTFDQFTKKSVRDRDAFEIELSQVRQQSYAVCDQEEFLHVCGIAAPVFGFEKSVRGGISVWSLTSRATIDDMVKLAPQVRAAAERISAKLGDNGT